MKKANGNNLMRKKDKRGLKPFYFAIVFVSLVAIWWIVAATAFRANPIVPDPAEVSYSVFLSAKSGKLWISVWNTLLKSIAGFFISFIAGGSLAILASRYKRVKYCVDPVVTLIRAVPTLAVTYLLLMYFRTEATAVIVGMMMVFPIFYAGIYAAAGGIDRKLLQMGAVYRVPAGRVLTGIVIPGISPHIFATALSAFSLNLKVVIAAEIVGGIAPNTIGNFLAASRSAFDYSAMFGWVLVAIVLAFVCEGMLKLVMRLCLPWKYPTRTRIKNFFCKMFKQKETASAVTPAVHRDMLAPKPVGFNAVRFSYTDTPVFENFSETFAPGKIHCIMGPSGSGKSTLLNLAAGLISAQSGEVSADQKIAYLFQEPRLIPEKTVLQNMKFVLMPQFLKSGEKRKAIVRAAAEAHAREYLAAVEMEQAADKLPHELSGGMAQRAALARAFAVDGGLLLMDEPFKGLDYRLKKAMRELFLKLYAAQTRTVLFVTHDIDEALLIADDIYVIGGALPAGALMRYSVSMPRGSRSQFDPELLKIKEKMIGQA